MCEFTCLNVKLNSVFITELVYLLPQGEKKISENLILNVNIFELFFVFLEDWYRYGNMQPKVFLEWQSLRSIPAHVLTEAF